MKKLTITKIRIGAFRNLKNQVFEFDGSTGVLFAGPNAVGKTNVLNAVMWCLTGNDLDGNSDATNFIPNDIESDVNTLVDVKVFFNNNDSINRTLMTLKGKRTVVIKINGNETETLKKGEVAIDEILGTLPLTLPMYQPSKLSIRKLLLNPLSIFDNTNKDLRLLVMKQIDSIYKPTASSLLENQTDSIKSVVKKYLVESDLNSVVDNLQKSIKDVIKEHEGRVSAIKVILNTEIIRNNPSVKKELNDLLAAESKKVVELKDEKVAIDLFIESINLYYQVQSAKLYKDMRIVLFEKGVSDDVYKEVFVPYINGDKTRLQNASTSEKVINAIRFINQYIKFSGHDVKIPVLVDEFETIDTKSVEELKKVCKSHFVVGAKVDTQYDALTQLEIK